jgi:hypothetical protein
MPKSKPKPPHWCVLVFIEVAANLCLCLCRIVHVVPLIIDQKIDIVEVDIEAPIDEPVSPVKEELDPDWIQIT